MAKYDLDQPTERFIEAALALAGDDWTRVVKRGVELGDVTTREFEGVDASANWFDIPEFGDWEAFFRPEGE